MSVGFSRFYAPVQTGPQHTHRCCRLITHVRMRKLPQPIPCRCRVRGADKAGGEPHVTCKAHRADEEAARAWLRANAPRKMGTLAGKVEVSADFDAPLTLVDGWECYAQPVALGGKRCGHWNSEGVVHNGLLCCEHCGATKYASNFYAEATCSTEPNMSDDLNDLLKSLLFSEHDRRSVMRGLRPISVTPKQREAVAEIARKLGCTDEEALARALGIALSITKHIAAGGRVVFVDADGKERLLRVQRKGGGT